MSLREKKEAPGSRPGAQGVNDFRNLPAHRTAVNVALRLALAATSRLARFCGRPGWAVRLTFWLEERRLQARRLESRRAH